MTLTELLAELYGATFDNAQQSQLIQILTCCALELDSRHPSQVRAVSDRLMTALENSSDREILTAIMAAAIRLRLPDPVILIP